MLLVKLNGALEDLVGKRVPLGKVLGGNLLPRAC